MEYKKLGSLAQFINGFAFKPEDWSFNGKKIIRIQNLTDHNKEFNYTERIVPDKYIVTKGDVLVSWSATIDVFIWNYDEQALLNQHIFKVIFDDNKVFKNYFIFALKHTIYELNKLAHGSTMRHIVKGEFENHKIPLPPYADQIRIANVLSKIEEVIQERKNAIDQLDELVKAIFYDMFGDPVRNEKGWDKEEIGKHSDSIVPGRDKPKSFTGNIPWITTDKLNNLGFLDKNKLNIGLTAEEIQGAKSKIIPSQSILMTCVGDLGIVSITVFDCVANQQLHSYQCYSSINNVFGMFCLSYNKSFMYRMASTTTVPYMNKTICNSIPIILPPIELQNQFAEIAQKIEALKTEQEAQLKAMEELYASISHQAFTGTLDLIRIPFDESLLPTEKEEVIEPIVIDKKEEPKEVVDATKERAILQLFGLSGKKSKDVLSSSSEWSKLSFQKIADLITNHFKTNYFNSEMLLRFLTEEAKLTVDYFSSKEQKVNLKLEKANDFLVFLTDAVTDKNPYLELEQIFYNAEEENISNITFMENDLESLIQKPTKERSGIYFRIKDETTTR